MRIVIRFLVRELRKERRRRVLLSGAFFLNLAGAILEGGAYFLMILAFSCLTGKGAIVKGRNIAEWLGDVTPHYLFFFFIAVALGVQLLKNGFCFLAALCNAELTNCCQADLQRRVVERFLAFSFSHVNRYKMGQLAELARTPTIFVRPFFEGFNYLVVCLFLIIVAVALMVMLSPTLTLCTALLFAAAFLIQKFFISKVAKTSQGLVEQNTLFSIKIAETLQSLRLIHIFGRENTILYDKEGILQTTTKYSKKIVKSNAYVVAISEISGIVAIGLMLLLGFFLMGTKEEIPFLLGFIAIVYRLSGKVQLGASAVMMMMGFKGQIAELEILFEDKGKEFKPIGGEKKCTFNGEIAFRAVSFSYPGVGVPVLHDLCLSIPKGKMVALVGKSGAGKSTILDLLLGLYTPDKGCIHIDGRDMKDFDLSVWREKIGVVTQEPFILSESIEKNIRFGKLDASHEEMIQAATMAHVHHFVSNLKEGYQTQVGERGYRLSGGEKQRLALARALIRDPEILIFDEPTSHLDSISEELIQHSLEKLRGEKTLIIVAHRLSTVASADAIFVMDKGKLLESGSHSSLIKGEGLYAQFWNKQASCRDGLLALMH